MIEDRPFAAGREVAQVQHGLETDAAHERHGFAVGREARRDGAAARARDDTLAAGREVAPQDAINPGIRVLVVLEELPGREVLAVVEVLAIRRECRLARVLLPAVALGHLQAVGAADVVHPDLAGAQRPLLHEMLARIDVLAVRRPGRTVHQPARLFRDLPGVRAIRIHQPDVEAAIAVADESDLLAVRTEARLHVEGGAACNARRAAAGDRDRVDVAEQVEDHGRPIGRDVDVHPGTFTGLELEAGRRAVGLRDIPLCR